MSTPLVFEVEVGSRTGAVEVAAPQAGMVVTPDLQVVFAATEGKRGDKGDQGDPGPGSPFVILSQAAYDALPVHDPNTLYVIQ